MISSSLNFGEVMLQQCLYVFLCYSWKCWFAIAYWSDKLEQYILLRTIVRSLFLSHLCDMKMMQWCLSVHLTQKFSLKVGPHTVLMKTAVCAFTLAHSAPWIAPWSSINAYSNLLELEEKSHIVESLINLKQVQKNWCTLPRCNNFFMKISYEVKGKSRFSFIIKVLSLTMYCSIR